MLSGDGSTLLNSGYLAGATDERALGIALSGPNSAAVVGMTASADFPTTTGAFQAFPPASYNGFVLQASFAPAASMPGDFDGNGHPDLVWQNDTTRQVTVNYYGGAQGNALQGWNWLYSISNPGWTIVGIADFNGDGKPDVVWQNDSSRQITVNYFGGAQGNALQGWNWLCSSANPGWSVAGVADFNGDGKPDLVWQNDNTRQVTVNYFGGAQGNVFQGSNWLGSSPNPGWKVVGIADFNGDGKPDLVWQNDNTRQVTVNYFGGAQGNVLQGWNWLNSTGAPGWHVAGAVDLNGDGKPDLVWQNDTTRQVTVNYFGGAQGTTLLGWNWLNASPAPGWRALVP
jgi:hypothetical protein